ncbi:MAG: M1 family metallopeptidase [Chitinophagales bacterium]
MNRSIFPLLIGVLLANCLEAQLFDKREEFSRKDSLRGVLNAERSCYDVTYYDLQLKVDIAAQQIMGSNTIYYTVAQEFNTLQIDLFSNLTITSISSSDEPLHFEREFDAVFVHFPQMQKIGTMGSIKVEYYGNPRIAKNPPWDGGFTFTKDGLGNPWVAVSCEGLGASVWWPNKDHLSDEPDSMLIRAIVPDSLVCIANGNFRVEKKTEPGWKEYDWFVSYPINNYNVSLNIGKYSHFSDMYKNADGAKLVIDYYVLPYNLEKAKQQFLQVKPMIACYENYMGKYPFYKDGYALVETPYLGMEHQGAIAYGNKYRTGYLGGDYSGIDLDFDYIIIHESAHEWWGNNVSVKDIADLWIHEGFGTYSETIYVECLFGYDKAMDYIYAMHSNILNDKPIIGNYDVNDEGSSDMYQKGALLLNTLRTLTDNDETWWSIIRGIQKDFALQTVTTGQIEKYISAKAGKDFSKEFDQYLRHKKIPVLEYSVKNTDKGIEFTYRWVADVEGFNMPIRYADINGNWIWFTPTRDFQTIAIPGLIDSGFKLDKKHFYFEEKKSKS